MKPIGRSKGQGNLPINGIIVLIVALGMALLFLASVTPILDNVSGAMCMLMRGVFSIVADTVGVSITGC
ncbi:MAG: hypothetical protein ABEK01_03640 [Candidatus Nanohaloarchaea archaeon]